MYPWINIAGIVHMMGAMANRGQEHAPRELHVAMGTMLALIKTAQRQPVPLGPGIVMTWRGSQPVKLAHVPIIIDEGVPLGGFLARPERLMNDPEWVATLVKERDERCGSNQAIQASAECEVVRSTDSIGLEQSSVNGVLIEAMAGCEDTRGIAVVKLKLNGDVELRTNISRFEVVGLFNELLRRTVSE